MKSYLVVLTLTALAYGCGKSKENSEAKKEEKEMTEQYRPQFHFTPPRNWMNDPNGMVYYEGEYHLFYQHYPDSNVWGPMHWGHAVSSDMVRWEHLPIALYPDNLGLIFSGSAVIDHNNTSGFGSTEQPPMVAMFTNHLMEGEMAKRSDFQTQSIAYSTDKGQSWKKYAGNPVIKNEGKQDFRDPKVFWHQESSQWVVILAVKDHVELYGSPNLKDWKHLSDFGFNDGAHGGVWECPDLFEMKIVGTEKRKWVMLVSINPGAYNGGSGTQYFTGDFNGKEFLVDKEEIHWLDYGKDNYAGVTWSNIPATDGRRLFLGWMSNWQYANFVPTQAWRSAMTVPRELSLVQTSKGLVLASNPVKELLSLRENNGLAYSDTLNLTDSDSNVIDLPKNQVELVLEIERNADQNNFEIELFNAKGEKLLIGLEGKKNQFYIDRANSGDVSFSDDFAGIHVGLRSSDNKVVKLKLLLDASSVELFADEGTLVMTEIFFPTESYSFLKIRSKKNGVKVKLLRMYPLKSIW